MRNSGFELSPSMTGIAVAIIAILLSVCLYGCQPAAIVEGGRAQTESKAADTEVEVKPDGSVTVKTSNARDFAATTQPSARSTGGSVPKIGAVVAGEIGDISFDLQRVRQTWPFVLILTVCGLALLYFRRWWLGACALAVAALASVAPVLLAAIAAVLLVMVLIWISRDYIRQLVLGAENILADRPEAEREAMKDKLAKAQDRSLQDLVKAQKRR